MTNAFALISQGGFTMILLGLCSVIAVSIIIERALALRYWRIFDEDVLRALADFHGEASADRALAVCRHGHGAFARVAEEVINARHLDLGEAVQSLHAVGRTQIERLERGLTALEIIAGIAPLLGLLGTVLGMVTVFNAITAHGLGNPQVLSDGISKALITTVAGLTVAIPALAAHSVFTRRVESFAVEMQDRATTFIVRLQHLRD